jgi:hypothetical protein
MIWSWLYAISPHKKKHLERYNTLYKLFFLQKNTTWTVYYMQLTNTISGKIKGNHIKRSTESFMKARKHQPKAEIVVSFALPFKLRPFY